MYKYIIIGAGAAGLFLGALTSAEGNGVILEAGSEPGRKILLSGGGRCNFTHAGDIRDFPDRYGASGRKVRSALYKFNNSEVRRLSRAHGIESYVNEEGRVFPKSDRAADIRDLLLSLCGKNGWEIRTDTQITQIGQCEGGYFLNGGAAGRMSRNGGAFETENLIVATGSGAFKGFGAGRGMQNLLSGLGIQTVPLKPALVPVRIAGYAFAGNPFDGLSGISLSDVHVRVLDGKTGKKPAEGRGPMVFTHSGLSGPVILNLSGQMGSGTVLELALTRVEMPDARGEQKNLLHFLENQTGLPQRVLERVIRIAGAEPGEKASSVSGGRLAAIYKMLRGFRVRVEDTLGMDAAMAASGGVSLKAVSTGSFEVKGFPGLFVIGEALDVVGESGGYNLQFAFSSAAAVSRELKKRAEAV